MIKRIWMLTCLLVLAACVVKPPVQEMAEARSAVKAAQAMNDSKSGSAVYLKSAEEALKQASEAIEQQKYTKARLKAREAKRQAQKAAKVSQKDH
ncbi:MAG: DUF4398 domain-containing protein [Mariprofundaceae bacterium]|nr:DUF4398 domain-containing protein [Mariprofundaceae bacterium]